MKDESITIELTSEDTYSIRDASGRWEFDATAEELFAGLAIAINDKTFGNKGIQGQYNSGNPRWYVGDGANEFFKFDTNTSWKGANSELTSDGNLICTGGEFGGFTLAATTLTASNLLLDSGNQKIQLGSGNDIITLDAADAIWRLAIGNSIYANAPFRVTKAGYMVATSGAIGNWAITAQKIYITGIELDQENNRIRAFTGSNYVDITAGGLTGYDSILGTTFRIFTDGSAPEFSSGVIKECEYQIYTSGVIRTDADPASNGGLLINNTSLIGYNSSGLKLLQFVYDGSDQGDAYIGDYDNNNAGLKYDHSAGTLNFRGTVELESMYSLPSDENLVGYWALDDGAGTKAIDGSGTGNEGTLNGDPSWETGIAVGSCLDFDQNDYVNCGGDVSLRITGDRTLTAWIELSAATYPNAATNWIIYSNELYQNYGFIWRIAGSSGKQYFRNSQSGIHSSQTSNTAIGNNTKRLVAVVIESGMLTFFLDGEADGGGSITAQIASSSDFYISYSNQGFDGKLDELRVYNKALTANEIKALYLYPAGNKALKLAGNQTPWAHASDVTKVDGGDVYANSITANAIAANTITSSEIKGSDFGTLVITSGKIGINATDALEIQSAGNLLLKAGSSLKLESHDATPGLMDFVGSLYTTRIGAFSASGLNFSIYPLTDNVVDFWIGRGSGGSAWCNDMHIEAKNNMNIRSYQSADSQIAIWLYESSGQVYCKTTLEDGGYIKDLIASYDSGVYAPRFYPEENNEWDLGLSTNQWKDLYVKDGHFSDSLDLDNVPVSRIKTGSYTGDGTTSNAITGIGFCPKYVKIWLVASDGVGTRTFETTTEMMARDVDGLCCRHLWDSLAMYDNRIISLDNDGFTVSDDGGNAHPNSNGVNYDFYCLG